jgi:hypothetical protein
MDIDDAIELDEVEETCYDERRWVTCYERVVKHDGKYYRFCYNSPKYEMNSLSDVNYGPIELTEVEQVEKVVKVWQKKS